MFPLDRFNTILRDEPGVYLFTNTLGTRFYVGTSSNVELAVMFNINDLAKGIHSNSVLQQFYNDLEGDMHLQVIYTPNLAEAKITNMRMALDEKINAKIMNPYFRRITRKERDMIITLARK